MILEELRKEYHKNIFDGLLTVDSKGIPSNADSSSPISIKLAKGIVDEIKMETATVVKGAGQTSGKNFERITAEFLSNSFAKLQHLRSGDFNFFLGKSIAEFEQYEHLAMLSKTLKANRELRSILGDYLIKPDIVIGRKSISDAVINTNASFVSDPLTASLTPLREANSSNLLLHASISCKWTLRSDRAQNARTEGLNLIRNRKGHTPHIVIITGEPYPQRISSVALGTGDVDCVYHFALRELTTTVEKLDNEPVSDMIETLVKGKRLRDISDLPFDLVA